MIFDAAADVTIAARYYFAPRCFTLISFHARCARAAIYFHFDFHFATDIAFISQPRDAAITSARFDAAARVPPPRRHYAFAAAPPFSFCSDDDGFAMAQDASHMPDAAISPSFHAFLPPFHAQECAAARFDTPPSFPRLMLTPSAQRMPEPSPPDAYAASRAAAPLYFTLTAATRYFG